MFFHWPIIAASYPPLPTIGYHLAATKLPPFYPYLAKRKREKEEEEKRKKEKRKVREFLRFPFSLPFLSSLLVPLLSLSKSFSLFFSFFKFLSRPIEGSVQNLDSLSINLRNPWKWIPVISSTSMQHVDFFIFQVFFNFFHRSVITLGYQWSLNFD